MEFVKKAFICAVEIIDSQFYSGYAEKHSELTGIVFQNLINNCTEFEKNVDDIQYHFSNDMKKIDTTQYILKENFSNHYFTATNAFDVIRPFRITVSKFKNEDSFQGTILRELQQLRDKGILHFVDNDGTYCFH